MGRRIYDFNAYARAAGWQPAPRPVQRTPAHQPTEAEILRESRQIYYGQLIHDGMDEEQAYQATVEHFAINDHRAIGAIREEE
jgi:hypothetical protein